MQNIWFDTVSIGQEISIQGEKYICRGIALCESNNKEFCEFMLYSKTQNKYKWLAIELNDNYNSEIYLYSDINLSRYSSLMQNEFSNRETYSSKATVLKCKGDFDADIRETYEYTEYYSSNKVLCIEDWDGEVDYSYGKEIEPHNIILGNIVETKSSKSKSTPKKPLLIVSLVLVIFLSIIFLIPSRIFTSYCSSTCSRYSKDWCCINVDRCMVTHKRCKSMYYTSSGSIRSSSYGSRNPIGGGTSFGK